MPGTTCCTCYNYGCNHWTWYSGSLINLLILSRPRHYVRPQEFQRRMGCQPAEIKPRDSDPLVGPSFHLLERGGWQVHGWLEKLHRKLLNNWKRDLTSGKSKGLIYRGPPSIFNRQISITSPPNLLLLDHLQALVLAVIPRFWLVVNLKELKIPVLPRILPPRVKAEEEAIILAVSDS